MANATTAAKAPPGAVYDMAAAFQNDLDAGVTAAHDQMLASWDEVYQQIRADYDGLLSKMEDAYAKGQPVSPAWLYQKERLKNALATTKTQVHEFAQQASAATVQAHAAAVATSAKAHAKMGAQAMQEAALAGGFTRLNEDNLKHLIGFLHDGSPVDALFTGLAAETAGLARDALIRGVTMGKGVDWISRRLDQALNVPRWRAETIVRSEAQRVYRSVARQTYLANTDVLEGWVWVAHLDRRTCPGCVVMDGKVMPVGSTLDGHPRCRCAMVPRTQSWEDLGIGDATDQRPPIRSGKEWLKGQPASVQRAILGNRKYAAWHSGQISLDDLVARHEHPVWGTTRRERSMVEILEGRNANYDDLVEVAPPPAPALKADPVAVINIKDTHTLAEIEATLESMPLTEQGRLNYLAAGHAKVAELPKGPTFRMPEPDESWATTATEKMNAAVLSKGYPSKGYSQTKAIYKAKANGTPGTKVGVVKSLTWQEKVNAQKALADHDEWLEHHLASKAAAKGNAKAAVQGFDADMAKAAEDYDAKNAYVKAKMALKFNVKDEIEAARGEAMVLAKWEKYVDEKGQAQGLRHASHTWENPHGDTIEIDSEGWGVLKYADGDSFPQTLKPTQVHAVLSEPDGGWDVPKPPPQPGEVQKIIAVLTDKDGYYDEPVGNALNSTIAVTTDAQQVANLQEALTVAKATLPWKPEPAYVAKILDDLQSGKLTKDDALWVAGQADTKPLSKANLLAAVKEYDEALLAASKPTVVQANPTAVATVLKKLDDGTVSPAHVKAKADGQTTKSPQIQANNAEALAQWEAKNAQATKLLDYNSKMIMLENGDVTPGYMHDLLDKGLIDPQHAPTWKVVLEDWDGTHKGAQGAGAPVVPPAAPKPPAAGFGHAPDPSDLKPTGQTLGTHGAKVYTDPQGNRWLFKPPKDSGDAFLSTLDEAASQFQHRTGLKAPDTYVVTIGGKRGSLQRMFDVKGDAFPGGLKPETLTEPDLLAVQKEQVLDWLLSNHDGHYQQFLRMPDGSVVGIDKGQAFRWMGQDRLDWDFHPNASYGAPEPVYNTLWRSFAQGHKVEALDPRHGPLNDYIKSVQGISDDEVRAMFRPYAEQAAARGRLSVPQSYPGLKPATLPKGDVEAFLDAIVARKNGLEDDFAALYDKAAKARQQALPTWKPAKPKAVPGTTGKAKWKDRPQPVKPEPPKAPEVAAQPVFDPWLAKVKAKYEAFAPGKTLEASNNWARVRRVIDNRDKAAVQELLDRHYLDADMAAEAYRLIDEAEAVVKAAEAAHDKAVKAYESAMTRWKRDVKDWREANGITSGMTKGMDVGKRTDDSAGNRWARKHWDAANLWSGAEKKHLQTYSGSDYSSINATGRRLGKDKARDPKAWGSWHNLVQSIDSAMDRSTRMPEDTILVRGTGVDSFTVNGSLLSPSQEHLLPQIVGSVQRDEGFMSSSVGKTPGFGSGKKVQMKILAPEGSVASYIDPISLNQGEREMLLPRGTNLYIHAAYPQNGRWIVEAEIVEDDFIPPTGPSGEPVVTPATERWDGP
jgi:SPP1 gp7 family putative phage head morphogenesis protein